MNPFNVVTQFDQWINWQYEKETAQPAKVDAGAIWDRILNDPPVETSDFDDTDDSW